MLILRGLLLFVRMVCLCLSTPVVSTKKKCSKPVVRAEYPTLSLPLGDMFVRAFLYICRCCLRSVVISSICGTYCPLLPTRLPGPGLFAKRNFPSCHLGISRGAFARRDRAKAGCLAFVGVTAGGNTVAKWDESLRLEGHVLMKGACYGMMAANLWEEKVIEAPLNEVVRFGDGRDSHDDGIEVGILCWPSLRERDIVKLEGCIGERKDGSMQRNRQEPRRRAGSFVSMDHAAKWRASTLSAFSRWAQTHERSLASRGTRSLSKSSRRQP